MIREIVAAVLCSPDFLLLALILAVVALVQGVKALGRVLRWLDATLQDLPARQFLAAGVLALATDLWAALAGNPVGHLLAATLTLLAWSRWRSSRVT